MRQKLLVILLVVFCLIFAIASSGCGQIKRIAQTGPSGLGQHADIGFGWDQGTSAWQEGLASSINSGLALRRADIDPYISLMGGNKILYQYNLSPIERENKGPIASTLAAAIKIIELKPSPLTNDVYIYDREFCIAAVPMPGVVCVDKSSLALGYVRFELEIPEDSDADLLLLFDGSAVLVLSRLTT